jgi:hypothetical protein
MQKEMKTLSARTQRLDAIDKASESHKGLAGVVETEVMESTRIRYLIQFESIFRRKE